MPNDLTISLLASYFKLLFVRKLIHSYLHPYSDGDGHVFRIFTEEPFLLALFQRRISIKLRKPRDYPIVELEVVNL